MKFDLKKATVNIFAFMLVVFLVFQVTGIGVFAAKTEITVDKSTKRSSVAVDFGTSVGFRLNAGSTFSSVGIELNVASNGGKVAVSELYRWDTDMATTLSKAPLASVEHTEWVKGDILSVNAGNAGLSSFEPGEYYFREALPQGYSFKFNWYVPAKDPVEGFVSDYYYDGAPAFTIDHNGDPSSFLKELSDRGKPFSVAIPEEAKISKDCEVGRLNIDSTLWTAVDGLGRTLPLYQDIGNKKQRTVGIFYWTWHNHNSKQRPANLNQILVEHPEAIRDYDNRVWNAYNGASFFWNEPLFGYYNEMDDYVLRKHAELLADAGIDFVLFDCTNGTLIYEHEFFNLLKVWSQAKAEGVNVPKISFMLPFWDETNNEISIKSLFYKLYRMEVYQDLWFYWEGKPVLMGIKKSIDGSTEEGSDILNFFTFRKGEPSYWKDDSTDAEWGWLHVYPQAKYYNEDGTVEQMTVGIAQNADYEKRVLYAMNGPHNMGRGFSMQENYSYTYTYRGEEIVCSKNMDNAHYYGINFQEQWDYALSVDPEIVFVTGWNEWLVGRYDEWEGQENAFPDQCNDANSRDIEPSKGELKDYYYYQLVANVRKYKGMSKPVTCPAKTIDINGGADQWTDVVTYNHYIHNTLERNNSGFQGCKYVTEATRNDFKTIKASYDDENFYFYAETLDPVTPYTDKDWIKLILDTAPASKDSKDWEEFEYIIGRETGTGTTLTLEKSTGGWNWEKIADVDYTVSGNVVQIKVPRNAVNMTESGFTLGFKFADNNLADGDIMTLYTDGDAAPGGRFCFVLSDIELEEVLSDDEKNNPGTDPQPGCGGCRTFLSGGSPLVFIGVSAFAGALLAKKKKH